jgi:hypothetical protein
LFSIRVSSRESADKNSSTAPKSGIDLSPFRPYIQLRPSQKEVPVTDIRTVTQHHSGQSTMKSDQWKTYRTRFLVKAKQLNSSLSFSDHLGRQHTGRKGDYLVESCDGVLSIAPRQIFEDIYVPMGIAPTPVPQYSAEQEETTTTTEHSLRLTNLRVEPIRIEKIKATFRDDSFGTAALEKATRAQRKIPQPLRLTPSRLGLM